MICLEVYGYCQECPEFEPDVIKQNMNEWGCYDDPIKHDTIIKCKHRQRCEALIEYLARAK